ncbi:hypothetical protein ACFQV8_02925 [Pseudonocardia benzenivorans]
MRDAPEAAGAPDPRGLEDAGGAGQPGRSGRRAPHAVAVGRDRAQLGGGGRVLGVGVGVAGRVLLGGGPHRLGAGHLAVVVGLEEGGARRRPVVGGGPAQLGEQRGDARAELVGGVVGVGGIGGIGGVVDAVGRADDGFDLGGAPPGGEPVGAAARLRRDERGGENGDQRVLATAALVGAVLVDTGAGVGTERPWRARRPGVDGSSAPSSAISSAAGRGCGWRPVCRAGRQHGA